jgi:uncharacterized protein (TIGR02001 family)
LPRRTGGTERVALAALGLAALAGTFPAAASAQVAFEAALQSDYRLRGYSASNGHAVASLSADYDDPSGAYAGGVVAGMLSDGDPHVLLLEGHAGYAVRIAPTISLDLGATHSQYYFGYGTSRNYQYSEAYIGIALPHVSARASYSPNYYFPHTPTLYAEVDGGVEPAPNWFLSAHAGALFYLDGGPYGLPDKRYDWRVGVSRQLGKFGLHVELSGRLQGEYSPYAHDKAALAATLTRAF